MQTPTSHAKPPLHPPNPLATPLSLFHIAPVSSMEEKVEPSRRHQNQTSSPNTYHQTTTLEHNPILGPLSPASHNNPRLYGAGTYIVQVPKDQVFRVPPPENGSFMDQINQAPQKEGRRCFGCSGRVFLYVALVLMAVIAAIIGLVLFLTPDNPGFQIEHVAFNEPPPVFHVRVKVQNPNKYKEISYDGDDSNVALIFKQKEIAKGKFPSFDQGHKNTTIVDIVLRGSSFPKEILTSMNSRTKSKARIPLSLSMNIPVQFKVAGSLKSRTIDVSCSFTVDRLDKDTKILDQKCAVN